MNYGNYGNYGNVGSATNNKALNKNTVNAVKDVKYNQQASESKNASDKAKEAKKKEPEPKKQEQKKEEQKQEQKKVEEQRGPNYDPKYPQCRFGIVVNSVDGYVYCAKTEQDARIYARKTGIFRAAREPSHVNNFFKMQYINKGHESIAKEAPYNTYKPPAQTSSSQPAKKEEQKKQQNTSASQQKDEKDKKDKEAEKRAEQTQKATDNKGASSQGQSTYSSKEQNCKYGIIYPYHDPSQKFCAVSEDEYKDFINGRGKFDEKANHASYGSINKGYFINTRPTHPNYTPAGQSDYVPEPPKKDEDASNRQQSTQLKCTFGIIQYDKKEYCALDQAEYDSYKKEVGVFSPTSKATGEYDRYFKYDREKHPNYRPAGVSDIRESSADSNTGSGLNATMDAIRDDIIGTSVSDTARMGELVSAIDKWMSSEVLQFDRVAAIQKSWDLMPTEMKEQMAKRSAEVRRLRELQNLDPCAEIKDESKKNVEDKKNTNKKKDSDEINKKSGDGETNIDTELLEPLPFLVPKKNIISEITGADREVTLINTHLFDSNIWLPNAAKERSLSYPAMTLPIETDAVINTDRTESHPFRYTSGKFWTIHPDTNELKFVNPNNYKKTLSSNLEMPYYIQNMKEQFIPSEKSWISEYSIMFPVNEKPGYFSMQKVAAYVLGASEAGISGDEEEIYKLGISTDEVQGTDTVFSAEQPFFKSELDKMQVSQFTSADINIVATSKTPEGVLEIQLPNLYSAYHKSKNINKLLEEKFKLQLAAETTQEANKIAQEIESIVSDPNQMYTNIDCDATTNIYKFPCQQVIEMQEANKSPARGFGNNVEISINTQQGSFISNIIHEMGMDLHILEYLTSENVVDVGYAQSTSEIALLQTDPVSTLLSESDFDGQGIIDPSEIKKMESDVNKVWNSFISERTTANMLNHFDDVVKNRPIDFYSDQIDKNQYPLSFEHADTPGIRKFIDSIKTKMFVGKLFNYLGQDRIRSYGDILKGEKCYSEMIGYRISKHIMVGEKIMPDPIQQFYFMDSDQIKEFKFIDTQVVFGAKYLYRVRSLNFVVGSITSTERPRTQDFIERGQKEIQVNYETITYPTLRIIEAPFFERIVSVCPKPPMAPQVSFLPFQGVDDKFQILVQTSFGEERQAPRSILPEDTGIMNDMLAAQTPDSEGKIIYKNDSLPKYFQIFRLSSPPSSYDDFSDSDYVKEVIPMSKSFLYMEDSIEPNKDYYYIFREFDGDGLSNPSDVYRIRMVSYKNGIYMDLDVYDMKTPEEDKMKINFGSALEIMPNMQQRSLRFAPYPPIDSREFALTVPSYPMTVGNSKNSVWGRKFKARIISKASGKKVDINFEFNRKRFTRNKQEVSQAQEAAENPKVCD